MGLAIGIAVGVFFLKKGFSLGRTRPAPSHGLGHAVLMVVQLVLLLAATLFGREAEGTAVGPIFFSAEGPGSQAAPIILALAVGLVIGVLAQRSRFCTVGAIRDLMLTKSFHLFNGIVVLIVAAFVTNLILGQFHAGFSGQPVAHTDQLWNTLGMVLAGLAFTLAGGCPGRQLIMSGEGDGDSGIFVLGMLAGAAVAHTFSTASSAKGVGAFGPWAVVAGLVICIVIGITMRERGLKA